jgi:hypothetical protein
MPLMQWIESTWLDAAIRSSVAGIRIAEIVHLLGLALFGGTVFVLNLTLFGFGPPRRSLSRIAGELLPWTITGFLIMALSGSVLFLSSPEKFYLNPALRVKLAILVPAFAFQFTLHRKIAFAHPPATPPKATLAACLSLLLWIGVGFAGKAIGPFAVQ